MDNQEKTPIVNTNTSHTISNDKGIHVVGQIFLFCPIISFIIFYVWITDIMIK